MTVKNLGRREVGTVDGASPTKLLASVGGNSPHRRALQIANCDAGRALFLRMLPANASAPTVSKADFDFNLAPRATITLVVGDSIDVWAINDSESVAASAYTCLEVMA